MSKIIVPFLNLKKEYLLLQNEIDQKFQLVFQKGEFCYGQETEKFEKTFAKFTNCKYCIATSSGTDSLIMALKALNIGKNDEVITTPFTFIATVEAIVNVGARPVFVDIDEKTLNIDINQIERKITGKTKAIVPVHMYGLCVDMDKLLAVAKRHKLSVIEDVAHADGSLYKGKPAGSLGNVGCFSFYPSKTLGAYGNAGAIVTNNKDLARKMKMIGNHGRINKNTHELIGFTGTINNLQAAFLNIKLKYLKKWIKRKSEIANLYNAAFEDTNIQTPLTLPFCKQSFYVYTIKTVKRDGLSAFLREKGIETQIYYPVPLYLQPSLKFLNYKKGDFPQTEKTVNSILSLPLNPQMTDKEVAYVIEKVKDFINF